MEHKSRPEQPREKPRQRSAVKADQQPKVEVGGQVQIDNPPIQEAGHSEPLGEFHQPVDGLVRQKSKPDRQIAKADDDEHRQDDRGEGGHLRLLPVRGGEVPPAGIFREPKKWEK